MKEQMKNKVTITSFLVALGIVYGDIGTSPLYVLGSILSTNKNVIEQELLLGALSLIFWTLTLQTTIKYVLITLRADNHGEGGIFSLYTLLRNKAKWLIIPAVIGGASLLADGMITPPITVTSAIEGLQMQWTLSRPEIILIVVIILTGIFFLQRYGTEKIGSVFGPLMLIWFSMLFILGIIALVQVPQVLLAINPYHGLKLLWRNPEFTAILGAVFLCTTGAEALYSDLGHCGRNNIYYSWIFVKIALVINYFGQGAYLWNMQGQSVYDNPFFLLMPSWFLIPGIIISTIAAIIASQALISGSFTLISEATKLGVFPRLTVKHPNENRGQLYIAAVNTTLYLGCLGIVFYFQESSKMEAAYGLAITITMLMTTILMSQYLRLIKHHKVYSLVMLFFFGMIESMFLYANIQKFDTGGYITILIGAVLSFIMIIWMAGVRIKARYSEYTPLPQELERFAILKQTSDVPLYCHQLVYLTKSTDPNMIDKKILQSIFYDRPKRARYYWFVHIDVTDEPYTKTYRVIKHSEDVYFIQFQLGFRVEQGINMYLRKVLDDLIESNELQPVYKPYNPKGDAHRDLHFVLLEEKLSNEWELSNLESFVMAIKIFIQKLTVTPAKWFGIDPNIVEIEHVGLNIGKRKQIKDLTRIQ